MFAPSLFQKKVQQQTQGRKERKQLMLRNISIQHKTAMQDLMYNVQSQSSDEKSIQQYTVIIINHKTQGTLVIDFAVENNHLSVWQNAYCRKFSSSKKITTSILFQSQNHRRHLPKITLFVPKFLPKPSTTLFPDPSLYRLITDIKFWILLRMLHMLH